MQQSIIGDIFMTTHEFKALNFNANLTTNVADVAEAEENIQQALVPFNEMEARKERLIDLLTVAVLDLLIKGNDATAHTRAEGQLPQLPSMADTRARIKLIAEKIAPTNNVNGKDVPDANRVSAICSSATDSLKASFLIGAGFPDAKLEEQGTGFRLGYYHNIGNSKNVSYQYCSPEEALDEKGELKKGYFASAYWKPIVTFPKRIINGEVETNTSDWKHAKTIDIRKAYNKHFLGYALNDKETDLKTNTKTTEEPTIYCVTQEHLKSDYTRAIDIMNKLNAWLGDGNLSTRYFAEAIKDEATGKQKSSPTNFAFEQLLDQMEKASNSLKEEIKEADDADLRSDLKQKDLMEAKKEELEKDVAILISVHIEKTIKSKLKKAS